MEDRLIIVDGATFVFSSRNGDVAADRPEGPAVARPDQASLASLTPNATSTRPVSA
jgi:hypothetical protein